MQTAFLGSIKSLSYEAVLRWMFLAGIILFPFSNALSLLLPLVGLLVCFGRRFRYNWRSILSSRVCIVSMVFIAIVLLHLFYFTIPSHALYKELGHYLFYIPMMFAGLIFCRPEHKRQVLFALLLSASIVALFQLILIVLHDVSSLHFVSSLDKNHVLYRLLAHPSEHHVQARGPFLAIGFLLTMTSMSLIKNSTRNNKTLHYFLHMCLAMIFVVAIFTQPERVGYLCFLAALCYCGMKYFSWRGLLLALFLFAALLFSAIKFTPHSSTMGNGIRLRLTQLFSGPMNKNHRESTQMRIDGLNFALVNIKYKPYWGFGIGMFHTFQPKHGFIRVQYPGSVEPSYVLVGLQLGLVGLICFLVLLLVYWHALGRRERHIMNSGRGILLVLCVSGLTFPVFLGTMGLSLLIAGVAPLLWPKDFYGDNA